MTYPEESKDPVTDVFAQELICLEEGLCKWYILALPITCPDAQRDLGETTFVFMLW